MLSYQSIGPVVILVSAPPLSFSLARSLLVLSLSRALSSRSLAFSRSLFTFSLFTFSRSHAFSLSHRHTHRHRRTQAYIRAGTCLLSSVSAVPILGLAPCPPATHPPLALTRTCFAASHAPQVLFVGVSVDLMETRQLKRRGEAYKQYQKEVPSALFLVPPFLLKA